MILAWIMGMLSKPIPLALACGFAAACIDETIQIFTPGRASSLIDVWIDTSGFALGLVVICTAYTIYNKIKGENLP